MKVVFSVNIIKLKLLKINFENLEVLLAWTLFILIVCKLFWRIWTVFENVFAKKKPKQQNEVITM